MVQKFKLLHCVRHGCCELGSCFVERFVLEGGGGFSSEGTGGDCNAVSSTIRENRLRRDID